MALRFLLDTNIILYHLGGQLSEPLPPGFYCVSVISEMELLSYPFLSQRDEEKIRLFLSKIILLGLSDSIKEQSILLRRRHSLRLPDAIICASALSARAEMLTNDQHLLKIPEIRSRNLDIA